MQVNNSVSSTILNIWIPVWSLQTFKIKFQSCKQKITDNCSLIAPVCEFDNYQKWLAFYLKNKIIILTLKQKIYNVEKCSLKKCSQLTTCSYTVP